VTEETGSTESGTPKSGSTEPGKGKPGKAEAAKAELSKTEPLGSAASSTEAGITKSGKSKTAKSKTDGRKTAGSGETGNRVDAGSTESGGADIGGSESTSDETTSAETTSTKSGSTDKVKTEVATDADAQMIGCPVCETELKSWQINCHGCGQSISSFEIPVIHGDENNEPDLMKAFQKWMRRGRLAFKSGSFDEAHTCFAEALKRVNGLETQKDEEIKARQKLADAFLKLNKVKEAVEQLVRATHLSNDEEQKQTLQKRIDYLNQKAESDQTEKVSFRHPRDAELMSAPLYCAKCHRLLSEREVYRFRSGKQTIATCVCAFEGTPVTPESETSGPIEPLPLGPPLGIKKAKLIEAAQKPVEGGRDRKVAIWLAVVLGNFGVHKFYLGEKALGIGYLVMCWTFVPWLISLYEAVHIAQMSRVSFNLVYNIEEIVRRLPPDVEGEGEGDVFNMEVSEDPEDLVDTWSVGDEIVVPDVQV